MALVVKKLSASAGDGGDSGLIPGPGKAPGRGHGNLLLPGESPGQRSLVGYSPWGHKQSHTTEAT